MCVDIVKNNAKSLEQSKQISFNVAIMTWYHYHNYGTVLQASSLYKIISNMGFETQLIQYHPVGNILEKNTLCVFCEKAYNWVLKRLFGPKTYHSDDREKLFLGYLNNRITETISIKTEGDFIRLNDDFDAFVCGSDQIWSPLSFNDKYYLSFVKNSNKKVAYAPSMGVFEIGDLEVRKRIAGLLKGFEHLSVREKQGAKIIKELTGQDAKVVLDPTLLLTAAEWDDFADISSAQKLPQPYILCYYLGKPSRYRRCVKTMAKKWKLPVFEIPTVREHGRYAQFPFEVGPSEFVSLIKNAAFVFTDSFHGMAFAANYKVPFAVFERFEQNDPRNQNSRIYSLIELLGLQERIVSVLDTERINKMFRLNYLDSYRRLETLRADSMEYLRQSLKEAVSNN